MSTAGRYDVLRARLAEPGIHGADCGALQRALLAILDMHTPYYKINGRPEVHRVLVSQEDTAKYPNHVCVINGFDACSPGDDHYVEACQECRWTTEDGDPGFLVWPCSTVRAIADALGVEAAAR